MRSVLHVGLIAIAAALALSPVAAHAQCGVDSPRFALPSIPFDLALSPDRSQLVVADLTGLQVRDADALTFQRDLAPHTLGWREVSTGEGFLRARIGKSDVTWQSLGGDASPDVSREIAVTDADLQALVASAYGSQQGFNEVDAQGFSPVSERWVRAALQSGADPLAATQLSDQSLLVSDSRRRVYQFTATRALKQTKQGNSRLVWLGLDGKAAIGVTGSGEVVRIGDDLAPTGSHRLFSEGEAGVRRILHDRKHRRLYWISTDDAIGWFDLAQNTIGARLAGDGRQGTRAAVALPASRAARVAGSSFQIWNTDTQTLEVDEAGYSSVARVNDRFLVVAQQSGMGRLFDLKKQRFSKRQACLIQPCAAGVPDAVPPPPAPDSVPADDAVQIAHAHAAIGWAQQHAAIAEATAPRTIDLAVTGSGETLVALLAHSNRVRVATWSLPSLKPIRQVDLPEQVSSALIVQNELVLGNNRYALPGLSAKGKVSQAASAIAIGQTVAVRVGADGKIEVGRRNSGAAPALLEQWPSGELPFSRARSAAATDPELHRFLLFGGAAESPSGAFQEWCVPANTPIGAVQTWERQPGVLLGDVGGAAGEQPPIIGLDLRPLDKLEWLSSAGNPHGGRVNLWLNASSASLAPEAIYRLDALHQENTARGLNTVLLVDDKAPSVSFPVGRPSPELAMWLTGAPVVISQAGTVVWTGEPDELSQDLLSSMLDQSPKMPSSTASQAQVVQAALAPARKRVETSLEQAAVASQLDAAMKHFWHARATEAVAGLQAVMQDYADRPDIVAQCEQAIAWMDVVGHPLRVSSTRWWGDKINLRDGRLTLVALLDADRVSEQSVGLRGLHEDGLRVLGVVQPKGSGARVLLLNTADTPFSIALVNDHQLWSELDAQSEETLPLALVRGGKVIWRGAWSDAHMPTLLKAVGR